MNPSALQGPEESTSLIAAVATNVEISAQACIHLQCLP